MTAIVVQLFGLILLIGCLSVGYWRWIRPRANSASDYGLLFLLLLALTGGFVGGPPWWIDDPRSFSWDLPQNDAGNNRGIRTWTFLSQLLE